MTLDCTLFIFYEIGIRQQAIIWTNVIDIANADQDIWHHMASLGHNELTHCGLVTPYCDMEQDQHWLR